jgi:hypothetical protein
MSGDSGGSSMYGMRVISPHDDRPRATSPTSSVSVVTASASLSPYDHVTSSSGVMTFGSVATAYTPPAGVTYAVPELKPAGPSQQELDRALITTIRSIDASLDHTTICRNHLRAGASPSSLSVEGVSAIHWAAFCKLNGVVELLIGAGASITDVTPGGQTALHWAAISGDIRCARPLMNAGWKLDAIDQKGLTPLHIAAQYDMQPCVDYMLLRGADINVADHDGMRYTTHTLECLMYHHILSYDSMDGCE